MISNSSQIDTGPGNKNGLNAQISQIKLTGTIFPLRTATPTTTMNYNIIITRLYFLLIHADGHVNDKELKSAKQMLKAESISEVEFNSQLEFLKSRGHEGLLSECIEAIKKLERNEQIRIVAWLCVLANADGFMDRNEWQLIYQIYHKELALPLSEIFTVQKELNRLVWMRSTQAVD
jgi:uncharacterized tellurite resistance protein B-like protein